jgi:hypothetical protein
MVPMSTTERRLVGHLNHVELVYRPGERALAKRVFELLGARVIDPDGPFLIVQFDPATRDIVNNVLYASEVVPEQWRLEQELAAAIEGSGALAESAHDYLGRLVREPQHSVHFGIHFADEATYEGTIKAVQEAGEHDPELQGRVAVSGVFRPGDPGALTDTMIQAFVRTDVVASGLLALGQHVELQYHLLPS